MEAAGGMWAGGVAPTAGDPVPAIARRGCNWPKPTAPQARSLGFCAACCQAEEGIYGFRNKNLLVQWLGRSATRAAGRWCCPSHRYPVPLHGGNSRYATAAARALPRLWSAMLTGGG